MKLNFKEYGSGNPLVILHGMFGSLDNWFSLGKSFANNHHVYLVDQRNHGQSPHSDTHTYDVMAADLFEFFEEHSLSDAVLIGHSMGGKTAMRFAADHPNLLSHLIVVDMGVKAYPVHHDLILRTMQSMDMPALKSRKEAEEYMLHMIEEESTVLFLTKNIYRQKQKNESACYAWRFNLDVLADDIEEMGMPILDGSNVKTLMIYGSKSDYILETDKDVIVDLFPNTEFVRLETGHWLHAEDPKGFVNNVKRFIEE